MHVDAETGTERSGEHTGPRGGTDKGEGVEVNLNGAGRRTLVNHDVDAIVLHGRIEVFLHHGLQAVYLIDEKHVARLQRREDAGQVTGLVEHRAGRDLETHAQLVGNDIAQRCLAQSRRSVEQRMVERLTTVFGGLHKDAQVVDHLPLAVEVVKAQRTERILKVTFLLCYLVTMYIELVAHLY